MWDYCQDWVDKVRCLEWCQAVGTYSTNINQSYYPLSEQLRNPVQRPITRLSGQTAWVQILGINLSEHLF